MAKQARTVLSLAFGLAVRYDAIAEEPGARHNPAQEAAVAGDGADGRSRSRRSARGPRLAPRPGLPGPPPDGQLEQIIEVMLGTSARIGEVLAIRKCDVDVTVPRRRCASAERSSRRPGKPTHRQPHPKTTKSTRTVSVPSSPPRSCGTAGHGRDEEPEHLLFFTRNGTPLTTNNVRRRLRGVMAEAGIEGVTPHSFRRTVATVHRPGQRPRPRRRDARSHLVEDHQGALHRARRSVNPVTAEILESLAPKPAKGSSVTDGQAE